MKKVMTKVAGDWEVSSQCNFPTITYERFEEEEIKEIIEQLTVAYTTLSNQLKKPNILLVGKTGAGKSSLVNAIFGSQFAKTGTGEPVTEHLEKFAPEDKSVVVYDTKGLEHGNHQQFLAETKQFMSQLRSSKDLTEHLHVIWYVIDMSHSRFQSFEKDICKELFQDISLIFILNKVDTVDISQVNAVKNSIHKARLSNCKGIFEVVADRKNYQFDCCPVCKEDNFRFKQRTKEIICDNENCKVTLKVSKYSGLEALISETTNQLPEFARYSFISAQEIDEKARLRLAKNIICECASASSLKKSKSTRVKLVNMATHLTILLGFRFFPVVVSQEVQIQFYRAFSGKSFFARLAIVLSDMLHNYSHSEALAIAIGVELCRLLCEFKMKAVGYVLQPNVDLPYDLHNFVLDITEQSLFQISNDIKVSSINDVVINFLCNRIAVYTTKEDWAS